MLRKLRTNKAACTGGVTKSKEQEIEKTKQQQIS